MCWQTHAEAEREYVILTLAKIDNCGDTASNSGYSPSLTPKTQIQTKCFYRSTSTHPFSITHLPSI